MDLVNGLPKKALFRNDDVKTGKFSNKSVLWWSILNVAYEIRGKR
jgi:hypothetical protein